MKSKLLGFFILPVLGAALIAGCGSSGGGEEEALEHELHRLNGRVVAAEVKEGAAVSKAEAAELEDLEGKISGKEGELRQVEESITGVKEERVKSTIPGNGTFSAEVDFIPGIYESSGGKYCYWATLKSATPSKSKTTNTRRVRPSPKSIRRTSRPRNAAHGTASNN